MSKASRKTRSESLSAACKRAAKEWAEKCNEVVEDPKYRETRSIKELQISLSPAQLAEAEALTLEFKQQIQANLKNKADKAKED